MRDGDEYVINGRKWWTTGAMNPECSIFIVMGKTDPEADRHRQQSMILVPRDTPGVRVVRPLMVFGYDDHEHGGHAEVEFVDVRVPASNLIANEGDGFAIAQARLGPGRIHHCMRSIGIAESGHRPDVRPRARQGRFRQAARPAGRDPRVDRRGAGRVEQLRLLTLKAAWLMDTQGNKARAHRDPGDQGRYARDGRLDPRQGDPGARRWRVSSQDFPLAEMYAGIRTLRLADGPDEVHKMSLGPCRAQAPDGRPGRS